MIFQQYKISRRINYPTTMVYKSEEYNCQMNELVSSRCKRNSFLVVIKTTAKIWQNQGVLVFSYGIVLKNYVGTFLSGMKHRS